MNGTYLLVAGVGLFLMMLAVLVALEGFPQ